MVTGHVHSLTDFHVGELSVGHNDAINRNHDVSFTLSTPSMPYANKHIILK